MKVTMFRKIKSAFLLSCEGTIAVAFGLLAPVMIGAVGTAMDLSQAYLVRQRLHGALDASALSAAAITDDEDEIEQRVRDYLAANYPAEKIGNINIEDVDITVNQNEVTVSAAAYFPTSFMKIMGHDHINVHSETTVAREVQGIEVVLVLDNTGSMGTSYNGKTNITRLKEASESFVNIMFQNSGGAEYIKIGLVPYAAAVNVGPYGLGLSPYDNDGDGDVDQDDLYGDGTPFVNNPYGYEYSAANGDDWKGCVYEGSYPLDVQDHDGPWDMFGYQTTRQETSCEEVCTRQWSSRRNRWITVCDDECTTQTISYWKEPSGCPSRIQVMTNDQAKLNTAINSMTADGYTYGNLGMVWGWRLISPDAPYGEGVAWDNPNWKKVIIMMTDGDNNVGGNGTYSGHGKKGTDHNLSDVNLDSKFTEVCESVDANDSANSTPALVYTIVFDSSVDISEQTQDLYRSCATDDDMYHYVSEPDELQSVFEQIARELSSLHLKS